jgi:hypothetical protein
VKLALCRQWPEVASKTFAPGHEPEPDAPFNEARIRGIASAAFAAWPVIWEEWTEPLVVFGDGWYRTETRAGPEAPEKEE